MQTNINLLHECVRGAAKFLYRDYFELENLQSSAKNTKIFVEKARLRVFETLEKSLSKYYKTIIFNDKEAIKPDFKDSAVLVEVLDGSLNFERAIPFFAVIATVLVNKRDQIFAEKISMNFPALGDSYSAERGKGAWLERNSANLAGGAFRLRASAVSKLEDAFVACDYSELSIVQKISSNIRVFESCAYQMALLVSGKVDFVLFPQNPLLEEGFDLLIREAGGLSYTQNGNFVASNFQLHETLKNL